MNTSKPIGLFTIERVVAFLVGPAVIAGSGWLSAFLAKELGVPISKEEIIGIFVTGGLGAGALAYKWLHGRQIEQKLQPVFSEVTKLEATPVVGGLIHTTIADLEGLAQSAAHHALAAVGVPAPVAEPPPADPIPAATDPAPSSAVAAEAGAAPAQ